MNSDLDKKSTFSQTQLLKIHKMPIKSASSRLIKKVLYP